MFEEYLYNELASAFAEKEVKEVYTILDGVTCRVLTHTMDVIHCEHPDTSNGSIYVRTSQVNMLPIIKVYK